MHISILKKAAVAALASCAVPVFSAVTPSQMVNNIRSLTTKSQALQAPAQSINLVNGPLIVIGLGPFPPIIAGFADIVQTATVAIATMQDTPPITDAADGTAIFNAFREFVRVHQVLLNILIGKAGLFNTVPLVGQPVAGVLRQIEGVVDTIAFMLIDTVQSRSADLREQAGNLKGTIEISIKAYGGASLSKRHGGAVLPPVAAQV